MPRNTICVRDARSAGISAIPSSGKKLSVLAGGPGSGRKDDG
jgi:hypothetical protein